MEDFYDILPSIPLLFTGMGAILGKLSTQVTIEDILKMPSNFIPNKLKFHNTRKKSNLT